MGRPALFGCGVVQLVIKVYAKTDKKNQILRDEMLKLCLRGWKASEALKKVGRATSWYATQRKQHPDWALQVSRSGGNVQQSQLRRQEERLGLAPASENPADVSFPDFCSRYLGQRLFTHQLQWWDLLEGRQPRDLHESMTFESREPNYMLINTPPNHAKSTTISVNWVTYLICTNPNIRITVVSKTQEMAKTFLYAVQQRLTHPRYRELQLRFGPVGGFKAAADRWTSTKIYVGGEGRDSGEKDPTLQAIGIGQQIYGSRTL